MMLMPGLGVREKDARETGHAIRCNIATLGAPSVLIIASIVAAVVSASDLQRERRKRKRNDEERTMFVCGQRKGTLRLEGEKRERMYRCLQAFTQGEGRKERGERSGTLKVDHVLQVFFLETLRVFEQLLRLLDLVLLLDLLLKHDHKLEVEGADLLPREFAAKVLHLTRKGVLNHARDVAVEGLVHVAVSAPLDLLLASLAQSLDAAVPRARVRVVGHLAVLGREACLARHLARWK